MKNKCLFLLIDILGFSKLVEKENSADVFELLQSFNVRAILEQSTIDYKSTKKYIKDDINIPKLKLINFSDTIVAYYELDSYEELTHEHLCSKLIEFSLKLLSSSMSRGISIRGAIDINEFVSESLPNQEDNYLLYFGKALINTHELEPKLNSIGISATKDAYDFFEQYNLHENFIPATEVEFLLKNGNYKKDFYILNHYKAAYDTLEKNCSEIEDSDIFVKNHSYAQSILDHSSLSKDEISSIFDSLHMLQFIRFNIQRHSKDKAILKKYKNSLKFSKFTLKKYFSNISKLLEKRKYFLYENIKSVLPFINNTEEIINKLDENDLIATLDEFFPLLIDQNNLEAIVDRWNDISNRSDLYIWIQDKFSYYQNCKYPPSNTRIIQNKIIEMERQRLLSKWNNDLQPK